MSARGRPSKWTGRSSFEFDNLRQTPPSRSSTASSGRGSAGLSGACAIKISINTLLGGAFLLEVDPMTSVRQLKEILSQMQGIPARQQSLIFRKKVLSDDTILSAAGVVDDSTLSLVLSVTTALTNVVATSEVPAELDSSEWLDLDGLEMFDVTGMSDDEQDELFSMLFGHACDYGDDRQGFILCRDGDKISMLQLGPSPAPGDSPKTKRRSTPRGDHRTSDPNSLHRLLKLQENIRVRARVSELQHRLQERKERRAKVALRRAEQRSAKAAEAAAAAIATPVAETPRRSRRAGPALPIAGASRLPRKTKLPPLGPLQRVPAGSPRRYVPNPGDTPPRRSFRAPRSDGAARTTAAFITDGGSSRVRRSLDGDLTALSCDPGFGEPDLEYGFDAAANAGYDSGLQADPFTAEPRRRSPLAFPPRECHAAPRRVSLPAVKPATSQRVSLAAIDVGNGCTTVPRPPRGTRAGAPAKPRCWQCSRRLKITATYSCRCGGSFCARCRHAEQHSCTFDYKTEGRRILSEATATSLPSKLPKI
mmetsp:Transcript_30716/g.92086  ORF Transcript_30716/g.92086 Transcript_30716/m.92086 type:complete len:536 (+) Transcript_30716:92-1699(+)